MSLKQAADIWAKLKVLREHMPDGVIHDAQVYQLKMWGPLAIQHVKEIEIGVKLEDLPTVEFRATGVTMEVPDNFNEVLQGLDRSVKELLGRHWATRVLVDGAVIFERQGRPRPKKNVARTIERLKNADAAAKQGAGPDSK